MENTRNTNLGTPDYVEIYASAFKLDGGDSLKSVMLEMPAMLGRGDLDEVEAEELYTEITQCVQRYQQLRDGLTCELIDSANSFLERRGSYVSQSELMKDVLRGLDMAERGIDPANFEDKSSLEAYEAAFGRDDIYESLPFSNLRTEFLERIGRLGLSKKSLERMFRELEKSPDCIASAAAIGRDGYALKCLTAMHLCLSRREVTAKQAAMSACLNTDFEAVGDAVRLGRMAAEAAGIFVDCCILAATMLGGALFVSSDSLGALAFAWGAMATVGVSLYWLYYNLPERAGKASIVLRDLIHRGKASAAEGWRRLLSRIRDEDDEYYDEDFSYIRDRDGLHVESPF